jgi:hypothetical protein
MRTALVDDSSVLLVVWPQDEANRNLTRKKVTEESCGVTVTADHLRTASCHL